MFNNFLKELKVVVFTSNPPKTNFWELLEHNKLSLISNAEADDSITTKKEAEEVNNILSLFLSQFKIDY